MRTGSEVTTINVTGCSLCNWVWRIGKSYSTTNVFNKPVNYKRFLLDQGDNLLRENKTTVEPPLTAIPLHNDHLSATAFLFGGQSIHWLLPCLNLSTTTTSLQRPLSSVPKVAARCGEVQMYVAIKYSRVWYTPLGQLRIMNVCVRAKQWESDIYVSG